MKRHPLVPPQRLTAVATGVVRLAMDRQPQPEIKPRAAGVAFVDPAGRALFLKRGPNGDHAGKWCFPGGGIEAGETAESKAFQDAVMAAGYDGVAFHEPTYLEGWRTKDDATTTVVYDPNKVRIEKHEDAGNFRPARKTEAAHAES